MTRLPGGADEAAFVMNVRRELQKWTVYSTPYKQYFYGDAQLLYKVWFWIKKVWNELSQVLGHISWNCQAQVQVHPRLISGPFKFIPFRNIYSNIKDLGLELTFNSVW